MNLSEIQDLKKLQNEYEFWNEKFEKMISRAVKMRWAHASYVHVENVVIHADDSVSFVPYTNYMDECDKETFTFPYAAFESEDVLFKYFDELMVARQLKRTQENEAAIIANKRLELNRLCKDLGVKSPLDNPET